MGFDLHDRRNHVADHRAPRLSGRIYAGTFFWWASAVERLRQARNAGRLELLHEIADVVGQVQIRADALARRCACRADLLTHQAAVGI